MNSFHRSADPLRQPSAGAQQERDGEREGTRDGEQPGNRGPFFLGLPSRACSLAALAAICWDLLPGRCLPGAAAVGSPGKGEGETVQADEDFLMLLLLLGVFIGD